MGYIILILLGLLFLWMMVSQIVNNILNSIEDRAIRKSGMEDDLQSMTDSMNLQLDAQIGEVKKAIGTLREEFYQQLPGLKDRVLSDRRRVDYINNVLPYKHNYKRKKR